METMTVRKIATSVLAMYSKFYECAKFHNHQMVGEKVINDQNFQIFVSDKLQPNRFYRGKQVVQLIRNHFEFQIKIWFL